MPKDYVIGQSSPFTVVSVTPGFIGFLGVFHVSFRTNAP